MKNRILYVPALTGLCFAACALSLAATESKQGIVQERFGVTPDGEQVELFRFSNANGISAEVINFGATLVSLEAPDRKGNVADVVLGFDTLEQYLTDSPYFGSTVGRFAGRIENGRFSIDGQDYQLSVNNGPNHLHGGESGFDKKLWDTEIIEWKGSQALQLTYTSPDGEEGYPGELDVTVVYQLTDANELVISYRATTNKPTIVNLTNHSYFNLAGHASGDVLAHEFTVNSGFYAPAETEWLIPTGEILKVKDTALDFRTPTVIGERVKEAPRDHGGNNEGYDLNYALKNNGQHEVVARLYDPESGRMMEVETSEPALQFYTGNFITKPIEGKDGATYVKYAGICLEPQQFPNAPNIPHFPSVVLRPGEVYQHTIVYRFSVKRPVLRQGGIIKSEH